MHPLSGKVSEIRFKGETLAGVTGTFRCRTMRSGLLSTSLALAGPPDKLMQIGPDEAYVEFIVALDHGPEVHVTEGFCSSLRISSSGASAQFVINSWEQIED